MTRDVFFSCVLVIGLCAGCATNPLAALPKHKPIDRGELIQKADAVLAYTEGAAESLPENLFAVAPLGDAGKDPAAEFHTKAEAMRSQHAELATLKARGILGEDNRGYLDLRNAEPLANAAEKNAVQKVMSAENEGRKELYRGIARASEEKGLTLTRVERVFAAQRLARSASGAIVQLPSNDDEYALFVESPAGKRVGQSGQPGDWIQIP
jgi:uncharacterized protein YdbL (DUF1318 family)